MALKKFLKILDENFKDYENEFLKLKSVTSVIKGIIRFDFLVIKIKLKNISGLTKTEPHFNLLALDNSA